MDTFDELLRLLKSDPTEDIMISQKEKPELTTSSRHERWDLCIGKLREAAECLGKSVDEIPEGAKQEIFDTVLSYEKRADELKSVCDHILQLLSEHRQTRGRTREEQVVRTTESGYDSEPTSVAVLSTYEEENKDGQDQDQEEDTENIVEEAADKMEKGQIHREDAETIEEETAHQGNMSI